MNFRNIAAVVIGAMLACLALVIYDSRQTPADLVVDINLKTVKEIYTYARDKVYMITNAQGGGGTGFRAQAPGKKKVIVTNFHVCHGSDGFMNISNTFLRIAARPARILARDAVVDTCLLEEVDQTLPALTVDVAALEPGDDVLQVGHGRLESLTVHVGHYRERKRIDIKWFDDACDAAHTKKKTVDTFFGPVEICVASFDALDLALVIFPGNSGSPMLDRAGHVRGLMFAGGANAAGAQPADLLLSALARLSPDVSAP